MSDLVNATIRARGGRIVCSVTLDALGRNVGGRNESNERRRCGGCGELGHDRKRCNGKGNAPKPHWMAARATASRDKPCSKCGETGHDARRHNGRTAA